MTLTHPHGPEWLVLQIVLKEGPNPEPLNTFINSLAATPYIYRVVLTIPLETCINPYLLSRISVLPTQLPHLPALTGLLPKPQLSTILLECI